ncbi:N-formylglutamate deformylase [Mucilaginibacter sp. UYP25]|uniref:N-formylglutamate amidohydrolase n=1 Tax=unclassified Mucilaginibacter TaxID=2617802 RepID=UPI003394E836
MVNKLILHVPHAGTHIPDRTGYVISNEALEKEMLLLNDWYTDDLFGFTDGIPVVADFSRVFCDVERFANDEKEIMSATGMGSVYTKCDDGSDLRTVSTELKSEILNKYYYPHHEKLHAAVSEQLLLNNSALIVDCHSFSNKPFKRDMEQSTPRHDICIGFDGYHTPEGLYKFTKSFFEHHGFTVKLNCPYSGSIVPIAYYEKDNRVSSIMIEINRDLYLVPTTKQKSKNYNRIKSIIKNFLYKVSELDYNYNFKLLNGVFDYRELTGWSTGFDFGKDFI